MTNIVSVEDIEWDSANSKEEDILAGKDTPYIETEVGKLQEEGNILCLSWNGEGQFLNKGIQNKEKESRQGGEEAPRNKLSSEKREIRKECRKKMVILPCRKNPWDMTRGKRQQKELRVSKIHVASGGGGTPRRLESMY